MKEYINNLSEPYRFVVNGYEYPVVYVITRDTSKRFVIREWGFDRLIDYLWSLNPTDIEYF